MGSPAYYPLIENGNNWYDCHASCELILDNTEELVFIISTFDRPEKRRVGMMLPGIPHRPNKTTRLSLELQYVSQKECRVTAVSYTHLDVYKRQDLPYYRFQRTESTVKSRCS